MPDDTLTLAIVLTAGGAVGTAALISGIIALLKTLPGVNLNAGGSRLAAFIGSAIIVVVAYAGVPVQLTIATGFAGFLAWYGIARLAMAAYDDVTGRPDGLRGPVTPG